MTIEFSRNFKESFAAICFDVGARLQAENTAELSKDLLKNARESLNGFTGIWAFVAEQAEMFAVAEAELAPNWDGEWIKAIDKWVDLVVERVLNEPHANLTVLDAKKVIEEVLS